MPFVLVDTHGTRSNEAPPAFQPVTDLLLQGHAARADERFDHASRRARLDGKDRGARKVPHPIPKTRLPQLDQVFSWPSIGMKPGKPHDVTGRDSEARVFSNSAHIRLTSAGS